MTNKTMTFVNNFTVADVAVALRNMRWSDKAKSLVKALATARNRTLSRSEMARSIGSDSMRATTYVLGRFSKSLALSLDPEVASAWRSSNGGKTEWAMFCCTATHRLDVPGEGDIDGLAFKMDETLARALDQIGFAAYQKVSARGKSERSGEDEDMNGSDSQPDDPINVTRSAEESGELDELDPTVRETLMKARVGQGRFRVQLLERWGWRCAVTGIAIPEVIVASHIKPWAESDNRERLDPANGLPLIGTLDRLFDCELISFDASGKIIISPRISSADYPLLNLHDGLRLRFLSIETAAYLAYHRKKFVVSSADTRSRQLTGT